MKYAANSAQQVGVDFDHLAAYITVISSTTRMSAETIGQAMKTLFARFSDIKQGFDVGEGVDVNINNVEKSLRDVGIQLRDSANDFRDIQDVISDLGKVWNTLTEVEQNNIAKQVAGIRQKEQFLALMEHQAEVEKALTVETESAGLAMDRYALYLDSVEAAQNRATASWEKLAQSAISSGMVTGFYDALAGLLEFVDKIGGVPTILTAIAVGLVIVYGNVVTLSAALGVLETILFAISAMNPLAWAAVAAGLITILIGSIETATEKLDRLNKEIEESNNKIASLRNTANSINGLVSEYEKLSSKQDKTTEESQRLLDVQNKLKESVPTLTGHFDQYGNFILDASNDMNALTEATYAQIEAEKKLRQAKINESASSQAIGLLGAYRDKTSADKGYKREGQQIHQLSESEKIQINLDWSKALAESKTAFSEMSDEAKQVFIQEFKDSGNNDLAKMFEETWDQALRNAEPPKYWELATRDVDVKEEGSKIAEEVYAGFSETMASLLDSSDAISGLIDKSMKGELEFADIKSIPPEYLDALTVEEGKLRLNIDLIKEKQLVEAEMSLQAIKEAEARGEATAQEVAVIELYYTQLMQQSQQTFGAFSQTAWQYDQLLWTIANDAIAAGYTFKDMEGNALTSAQSIYDYMSKSDANFNNFIAQAANATGRSVADTMNAVNGMVVQTYNSTVDMLNSLADNMESFYAKQGYGYSSGSRLGYATPTSVLFPTKNPSPVSGGGFGGGGGSSSSSQSAENKAAEKLRQIEQDIADARKDAIDDLKEELKLYKGIVDAQKKSLDIMADQREYNQDVNDKNKEILNVTNELNDLQFDDTEEANARKLALQEELAELNQDLDNINYDQGVEMQKNALDAEYEAFQLQLENAINAIEDISATTVAGFASKLATILNGLAPAPIPSFHTGAKEGIVGKGMSLKSNELFAKLMTGEVVSTPDQIDNFMTKTLPQMIEGSSTVNNGGIQLSMPITIQGNADPSVIPQIEAISNQMMRKLNEVIRNVGYTRNANSYSI